MDDIVKRLQKLVGVYIGDADIDDELLDAKAEIERLREALSVIWGWYPTSISNPHSQIKKMREVADLALNDGDFRQYIKNHYAALEEGE